jgi:hypothetical protein
MAQKKVYKKKTKNKKVNVSQSVVVNVIPKSRAKKSTTIAAPRPTFFPQQQQQQYPFSITELAKLLKPESKATQETQTTPFKEEIKIDKSIPINELLTMLPKVEKPQKLNKSELGEKKNMFQEDLASEQLRYIPEVPKLSFDEAQRKTQEQLNYYNEVEGIPLVEAEVKSKRKYVKSGKYSKKKSEELIKEEP